MKEYKIGDTVWTRKRGKGRIVNFWIESTGYRPWLVRFEGMSRDVAPKAENLYPSEAAMNADQMKREAFDFAEWFKLVIDKACKPIPPRPPFASGGIVHDPHLRGSDFMFKPDPIQPKFKVGDAVYYKGKKYTIRERYWSGEKWKYNMTKPIDAESGNLLIGMNESDLRLWKETVLTHCLQVTGEWRPTDKIRFFNTEKYDILNYVGTVEEEDRFIGYKKSQPNHPYFFRGIKGDDI